MMQPRLLMKDTAGFSGVWREVHFDVWTSPGSAAHIRARLEGQRALIADLPPHRQIVTVAVVSDAATRPLNDDQRAAVDEGVRATATRVKGAAVVIEAAGFKAVIIRSFIAALTLVSSAKHTAKSFDAVAPMFPWVAALLDADAEGKAPTAADVQTAYEALHALARER